MNKIRSDEILKLSEKISYDDLTYHYKGKNIVSKRFNGFDNTFERVK